jgi:hypothetical protein
MNITKYIDIFTFAYLGMLSNIVCIYACIILEWGKIRSFLRKLAETWNGTLVSLENESYFK